MTKQKMIAEQKRYAQWALFSEYGFFPTKRQIEILDDSNFPNGKPQYVHFRVETHEYRYDGVTLEKRW